MQVLSTTAIAGSRVFPAASCRTIALERVAMFCAAGLSVSLLSMTYGLDLSAGLF
jgi:hypothetical protein